MSGRTAQPNTQVKIFWSIFPLSVFNISPLGLFIHNCWTELHQTFLKYSRHGHDQDLLFIFRQVKIVFSCLALKIHKTCRNVRVLIMTNSCLLDQSEIQYDLQSLWLDEIFSKCSIRLLETSNLGVIYNALRWNVEQIMVKCWPRDLNFWIDGKS